MSYVDEERLELIMEMIDHIDRRLEQFSRERFLADRDEVDLTAYRLSIIGENCSKLGTDIRARHAHIDWAAMYAMRNVIAHDYVAVDPRLVWATLGEDLASLAKMCRSELSKDDSSALPD